jgi:hypothetical protein
MFFSKIKENLDIIQFTPRFFADFHVLAGVQNDQFSYTKLKNDNNNFQFDQKHS